MIQITTPITTTECTTCHRAPLHVFVRGRARHFVECPRCGTRTQQHATRDAAIADFTARRTERIPAPLRRVA